LLPFATYLVITRVRWVFVFLGNSPVWVFEKFEKSKNRLDPVLFFLGDFLKLPRFRPWKSIEG
jgi:hypothetical protein